MSSVRVSVRAQRRGRARTLGARVENQEPAARRTVRRVLQTQLGLVGPGRDDDGGIERALRLSDSVTDPPPARRSAPCAARASCSPPRRTASRRRTRLPPCRSPEGRAVSTSRSVDCSSRLSTRRRNGSTAAASSVSAVLIRENEAGLGSSAATAAGPETIVMVVLPCLRTQYERALPASEVMSNDLAPYVTAHSWPRTGRSPLCRIQAALAAHAACPNGSRSCGPPVSPFEGRRTCTCRHNVQISRDLRVALGGVEPQPLFRAGRTAAAAPARQPAGGLDLRCSATTPFHAVSKLIFAPCVASSVQSSTASTETERRPPRCGRPAASRLRCRRGCRSTAARRDGSRCRPS